MLDPETEPADERGDALAAPEDPVASDGLVDATQAVDAVEAPSPAPEPEPAPARPAPPRVAIRVIDHPTDWADGDGNGTPRVSTVIARLPSFDASFFDAPPTTPLAPAEGGPGGIRVHTGAEQDASFGDFVGGGESADGDSELPGGVTAAVRRTAPLSAEVVASAAAAVQYGIPEPAVVDVPASRRGDAAAAAARSRRRTAAIVIPTFFGILMVLTVFLTRGPSRPKLDASSGSSTTAQHATTTVPQTTTTAAPTATTTAPTDTVPAATTGTVGPASAGSAQPAPTPTTTRRSGGSGGGGGGGGGSTPTTQRQSPPTTAAPPPTTIPAACPPWVCPAG